MNKLLYGFAAIGLMSCTLPSCKLLKHKPSKKKKAENAVQAKLLDSATSAIKNNVVIDTNGAMKAMIAQTAPVWQKRIDLRTFSTKAKMHYEGGDKSYDFIANIRMQKDSVIWVSVTVAGIVQVARAIITPDSFKAILYTEKQVFEGPISKVNNILPEGLDFYSLQNVLLGNLILNHATPVSITDTTGNWLVRFQEQNYIEQASFDRSDSTLRESQLITQGISNKSLSQVLSSFGLFNNLKIATDRKLHILSDSTSMIVEMNYANIVIDNEQSYPFSIPKNYTVK